MLELTKYGNRFALVLALVSAVPLVPAVKARVRALSMAECRATALEALDAADGAEVRAIVARRHG